jgi:hypothetical protein
VKIWYILPQDVRIGDLHWESRDPQERCRYDQSPRPTLIDVRDGGEGGGESCSGREKCGAEGGKVRNAVSMAEWRELTPLHQLTAYLSKKLVGMDGLQGATLFYFMDNLVTYSTLFPAGVPEAPSSTSALLHHLKSLKALTLVIHL